MHRLVPEPGTAEAQLLDHGMHAYIRGIRTQPSHSVLRSLSVPHTAVFPIGYTPKPTSRNLAESRVGGRDCKWILRTNQKLPSTNPIKAGAFLDPFPSNEALQSGSETRKEAVWFKAWNSNHTPSTEHLPLSCRGPAYLLWRLIFVPLSMKCSLKTHGFLMTVDVYQPIVLSHVYWHCWGTNTWSCWALPQRCSKPMGSKGKTHGGA